VRILPCFFFVLGASQGASGCCLPSCSNTLTSFRFSLRSRAGTSALVSCESDSESVATELAVGFCRESDSNVAAAAAAAASGPGGPGPPRLLPPFKLPVLPL
jgi:hypothetical protein